MYNSDLIWVKVIMKKNQEVTVEWFDELKGIGEGLTNAGKKVFLNSNNIQADNRFLTLKSGEKVSCDLIDNPDGFFASKINRIKSESQLIERSTFLEIT